MVYSRALCVGMRSLCTGSRLSLVGRDITDLRDLYSNDMKTVLWTALDLKDRFKGQNTIQILQGRHVLLLMTLSEPFTQAVASQAVRRLGGTLSAVVDPHLLNMDQRAVNDLGRSLSTSSDAILVCSEDHSFITKMADGAIVPTVAWRSEKYAVLQSLADTLTIYEHFKVLSPLTLSWVGPPNALFNSYLYIMPRMKTNLRFCCNDSESSCQTSPAMMNVGIQNAITNKTELHECSSPAEAVYRTDVIVTTGHAIPSLTLSKKHINEASLEYLFLHDLPRGKCEVSEEVFGCKHSATWRSRENLTWITMAVLVNILEDYRPSIPQPKWEIQ